MTDHDLESVQARLVLDARPGPAARISKDRANAMVEAALDSALDAALTANASDLPNAIAPAARISKLNAIVSHPAARAIVLAAAALLMLVGGAAAAKLVVQAFFADEPAQVMPAPAPAVAAPAPPKRATAESAIVEPEPAIEAPEEPALVAPTREARETRAPEDLLQHANRARTAGKFREAAETYALVYERHPSTLSAYVAEVAAASIELEHLDSPAHAARLFRHALRARPKGALDLEARQGLALALRDLGQTREEIAVLRSLVVAHPDRPAATRARARLVELNAP